MKRKVVKQGAATLMISLPAKWARENSIEKGSEVEMEQMDDNLVISSKPFDKKSEIAIKLTGMTESAIRTFITNTYRKGFDKIKVSFQNEQQFRILSEVVKTRLVGFDVITREGNSCVVENITEPSSEQFDAVLDKVFMNIDSLFDVSLARFEKETKEMESFEEIEERIQKYDNFCRRVISKRGIPINNRELLWTFLSLIIHGQREIYFMNRALKENFKGSNEIRKILEGAKNMFNLIKRAYKEKNAGLIYEVHDLEKKLVFRESYDLLEKVKGRDAVVVYHIASAIRQFYLANSPLLGLLL